MESPSVPMKWLARKVLAGIPPARRPAVVRELHRFDRLDADGRAQFVVGVPLSLSGRALVALWMVLRVRPTLGVWLVLATLLYGAILLMRRLM